MGSCPSCLQRLRPRKLVRLDACGPTRRRPRPASPGAPHGECSAGLYAPSGRRLPRAFCARASQDCRHPARGGFLWSCPQVGHSKGWKGWSALGPTVMRLRPHKGTAKKAGAGAGTVFWSAPRVGPARSLLGRTEGLSGSPGAGESGALSLILQFRRGSRFSCDSPGGGLWRAPQTATPLETDATVCSSKPPVPVAFL